MSRGSSLYRMLSSLYFFKIGFYMYSFKFDLCHCEYLLS